jgi:hypothetical protein
LYGWVLWSIGRSDVLEKTTTQPIRTTVAETSTLATLLPSTNSEPDLPISEISEFIQTVDESVIPENITEIPIKKNETEMTTKIPELDKLFKNIDKIVEHSLKDDLPAEELSLLIHENASNFSKSII